MKRIFWTVVGLFCASLNSAHATGSWFDYPEEGLQLGQGWSTLTGTKTAAACLENVAEVREMTTSSGTTLGQVTDKSQVFRGLTVNATAQANAIIGSGSSKVTHISQQDIRSDTTTVAVHSFVSNGPRYLGIPSLSSVALAPANGLEAAVPVSRSIKLTAEKEELWKSNRAAFYRDCGTHYVAVIHEGAEIVAFLKLSDLSIDEQNKLDVTLSGSAFGVTASANLEKVTKNIAGLKSLNLNARKSGGWGTTIATDLSGLLKSVEGLSKDAAEAPKPFRFFAVPYADLSGESISANLEPSPLNRLTDHYWKLLAIHGDALDVAENKAAYILGWGTSEADLDSLLYDLQGHLAGLRRDISGCLASGSCTFDKEASATLYRMLSRIPLKKRSFVEDVELRSAAENASDAVSNYNNVRSSYMKMVNSPMYGGCGTYQGNRLFTQWSEPSWRQTVWPVIERFLTLSASYPEKLKARMVAARLESRWTAYCRPAGTDSACIERPRLREIEKEIVVKARQPFVNGNGIFPFGRGEATMCGDHISAKFQASID